MKRFLIIFCMLIGVAMAGQSEFSIKSADFIDKGSIPAKYSFKQENISPNLSWVGVPKQVKSFALIVIDYDAKAVVGHPVVHWVVYNIPNNIQSLNVADDRFPMGLNSYNTYGYRGMNPPPGQRHNYHFYLYALNVDALSFASPPTADDLLAKIQNNVIGTATMVGNFAQDF